MLDRSGAGALLRGRGWRGVLAFNYHRIGDPRGWPYDRGVWTTTPDAFDEQVAFLARHADLIAADELPAVAAAGGGRHVMITFDDGYRDNHEVALPILRSHGARATFFVATGFVDEPRLPWWDELAWIARADGLPPLETLAARFKALPAEDVEPELDRLAERAGRGRPRGGGADWMTWEMVRDLRDAGMAIGAHSVTHPVLARQPPARQRWEIETSKRRLEEELGRPVRAFSYPEGTRDAFDVTTRGILHSAGFELAFSFYGGWRSFREWDPFDVRRTTVSPDTPPELFRATVAVPRVFARVRRPSAPQHEAAHAGPPPRPAPGGHGDRSAQRPAGAR